MMNQKILLVDDEPENLKSMVHMFSEMGSQYTILQTKFPEKAVQIALNEDPNLIITDWEMPGMDGLDLIRSFNKEEKLANVPVIMATGVNLTSEDLKKALEAGAVDYIRKPIDKVELMARCNSALKISEFYNRLVSAKAFELAETSLSLIRNKKFKISVTQELDQIIEDLYDPEDELAESLKNLNKRIKQKIQDDGWHKFQLSFNEVHSSFNKTLLQKHPRLTPSEIKLCQLIRLGMSSKDIATLQYMSYDSVRVMRSRLRKKLDLGADESLEVYLVKF